MHLRSGDDSLEEEVISRLDAHLVSDALEKVPEKYREVLRLRYFEELPYSIIAEKLGIPESTVKTRLFKARKLMRRIVEEERLTDDRR